MKNVNSQSEQDVEIIKLLKSKKEEECLNGLELAYKKYKKAITNYLNKSVKEKYDCKDLAQNTFTTLLKNTSKRTFLIANTRNEDEYLPCEEYKNHEINIQFKNIAVFKNENEKFYYVVYDKEMSVLFRSEGFISEEVRNKWAKKAHNNLDNPKRNQVIKEGSNTYKILRDHNGREIGRSCPLKENDMHNLIMENIMTPDKTPPTLISHIYAIANILKSDYFGKKKKGKNLILKDPLELITLLQESDTGENPYDNIQLFQDDLRYKKLWLCLEKLKVKNKLFFILKYKDKLSLEEIADETNEVKPNEENSKKAKERIKNRLHESREKMKECLGSEFNF